MIARLQELAHHYLVKCLDGISEEVPELVDVLQGHADQLRETQARLSLLERAVECWHQASMARILNSGCQKSDDPIRPIRLIDGSMPIDPFPETLGDFERLSERQLLILARRYRLGDGGILPEGPELRDLVFEYLGITARD